MEKVLDEVTDLIEREDLSEMIGAIEKKILEEDYTAMDLAAAFLRMAMGDEVEDTIDDFRTARDLDDLDRPGRGRRGKGGRGDYRDGGRDEVRGRGRRGGSRRNGNSDMVRLFINVGKNHNVKPGDVLGAIAGESGMPGSLVGSIDMYDRYTFVEVPEDCAEEVLEAMKNSRIKGKNIHMEMAKQD